MKNFFFLLTLCFSISQLTAQTMSSIPLAKLETLHSDIVGEDYKLHITIPFGYNPNGKKLPVLYYLDAWGSSGTVNELGQTLMWFKNIDPVILVGISYETDPITLGKLRGRDYTPPLSKDDVLKGGDKFLQFIKKELIPHMEKNYPVNENKGLMGHSLGGLFCTYVLKEEPDLFDKFIITSPALWYGDGYLLKDEGLLKNINNASEKGIFIAAGSLEHPNMISAANQLYDLVKTNKNIQSQKVIFDEEDHGSVVIPASSRGIRYLYKNKYNSLIEDGFDFYKKKNFQAALKKYEMAFEISPKQVDVDDRYNIACFYALTNNSEKAFHYLQMIADSKYDNYKHITKDTDFTNLHNDKRWEGILAKIKMNAGLVEKY